MEWKESDRRIEPGIGLFMYLRHWQHVLRIQAVSGLWAQFGHICLLSMRLESFFAKGDSASLESAAEDRSDGRPAK
jgi:hypothetical protein